MKKTFFLSIAVCLLASCGKLTVARQPQLDEETKRKRADLIAQTQYEIFCARQKAHIGKTYDVLVDGFDEENLLYLGRTYMDCIEIDAQVILSTEEELFPGQFVKAIITGVCDADLVGEVIV